MATVGTSTVRMHVRTHAENMEVLPGDLVRATDTQLSRIGALVAAIEGFRPASHESRCNPKSVAVRAVVPGLHADEAGPRIVRQSLEYVHREGDMSGTLLPALLDRSPGRAAAMCVLSATTVMYQAEGMSVAVDVGAAGADAMISGLQFVQSTLQERPDWCRIDGQAVPWNV